VWNVVLDRKVESRSVNASLQPEIIFRRVLNFWLKD
jgi:hypothetical protein